MLCVRLYNDHFHALNFYLSYEFFKSHLVLSVRRLSGKWKDKDITIQNAFTFKKLTIHYKMLLLKVLTPLNLNAPDAQEYSSAVDIFLVINKKMRDDRTGELFKPLYLCYIAKEEDPIYQSANNVLTSVAPVQTY